MQWAGSSISKQASSRSTAAQVSLLNFLRYNVAGGGDSALYGVEGPGFYLRSGALALNLALPLAAAAPLALLFRRGHSRPGAGAHVLLSKPSTPLFALKITYRGITHRHFVAAPLPEVDI